MQTIEFMGYKRFQMHLRGSWLLGCDKIARPARGTRPSDSLADTLFGISLAPVLRGLSLKLAALEVLFAPAPPNRSQPIPEHHDPLSDAALQMAQRVHCNLRQTIQSQHLRPS